MNVFEYLMFMSLTGDYVGKNVWVCVRFFLFFRDNVWKWSKCEIVVKEICLVTTLQRSCCHQKGYDGQLLLILSGHQLHPLVQQVDENESCHTLYAVIDKVHRQASSFWTMSLRTRINGFTAWVNLRLTPSGYFMHNILTDLLKGYNMKVLLESKYHYRISCFYI